MINDYLKLALRQLLKNKAFAILNILGLSIGIASALLIYEYTRYEKSFDSFHDNFENIYRVTTVWNKDVTPEDQRVTTVPWSGPGAKEAFPEIEDYTRFARLILLQAIRGFAIRTGPLPRIKCFSQILGS